jgi:acyl carrier protein
MRERLKGVIAELFGLTTVEIPDDADSNTLSGWDSLRHLELMLALEEEFEIRIPADAILELVSLERIDAYLSERAPRR